MHVWMCILVADIEGDYAFRPMNFFFGGGGVIKNLHREDIALLLQRPTS